MSRLAPHAESVLADLFGKSVTGPEIRLDEDFERLTRSLFVAPVIDDTARAAAELEKRVPDDSEASASLDRAIVDVEVAARKLAEDKSAAAEIAEMEAGLAELEALAADLPESLRDELAEVRELAERVRVADAERKHRRRPRKRGKDSPS